ncbi:Hypothetical predicted protein, partial [Scomber scombrus]
MEANVTVSPSITSSPPPAFSMSISSFFPELYGSLCQFSQELNFYAAIFTLVPLEVDSRHRNIKINW